MDKGARGVRAYLIPELGGNVYVDADTGKLASYTWRIWKQLQATRWRIWKKAGELSGYKAEIDPDQDVAASSTVDIVLKRWLCL